MNIGIDIRCLMERELTGVGEYALHLLKHLFELDNINQYYLFYNSRQDVSKYVPHFPKDNAHYCEFRRPNKMLNFSLKFFKRPKLDKWIEKTTGTKIDLFFFPNIIFFQVDCPYVITAHDLSFAFFPRFLSFKKKLWHLFVDPKKLFRNADRVISVSKNTTEDLINHYLVSPQKIKTVYSGISQNYKIIDHEDVRLKKIKRQYNLPDKFILYLGTVEPRKNVNNLIKAHEQFCRQTNSDYALVVAGKYNPNESKKIRILRNSKDRFHTEHLPAGQAGSDSPSHSDCGKIIFTNFIPSNAKRYFYNLASLFVYPSFYEGFGFPPLEAMACGCPVITSNNSSLTEICAGAAIAVDPHDINDLTEAMKEMILNNETRKIFIERGLARAKEFSWYKAAQDTLTLFNGLTRK
ncbi:MAG: glycosyltransferase family 1 protein [Parcubacteria group bacterium]